MNGGGRSPVPILDNVRMMIENIKEVVSNSTGDEEIYEMLVDCGMDADEATQRLLQLGSFQEVKTKRNKKKEILNRRPKIQGGRANKVYRGRYVSSQVSNEKPTNENEFTSLHYTLAETGYPLADKFAETKSPLADKFARECDNEWI